VASAVEGVGSESISSGVSPCMATIIGVSGRKYHGKDTFSRSVVEASQKYSTLTPFELTHFADKLKDQAMQIFGITEAQAYDPTAKETPFQATVRMDEYVGRMREVTGLAIQTAGLTANSPRELLQYYGTEYVRGVQDDYWIRATLDQEWDRVLISDVRFPNEAKAIRAAGGKIVKVVRTDMPDASDGHASETSIDLIRPDILLRTRTGDFSRSKRMAHAVAIESWETARALEVIFQGIDLIREDTEEFDSSDEEVLSDSLELLTLLE